MFFNVLFSKCIKKGIRGTKETGEQRNRGTRGTGEQGKQGATRGIR